MNISFKLEETFPVSPQVIYHAWLDSEQHSNMTGGSATCSNESNGSFSAWDGYISGFNKSLVENQKIIQSWRTTAFESEEQNSEVLIELKETEQGCLLTLTHTGIPEGQPDYKKGWNEHYFTPMKAYFN